MIFKILDQTIGFINRNIAAIGISAGVALAFVNVVARYAFNSSLTWAAELTVYLFLWSTFFAAAYCFKQDAHINISLLLENINPKLAKILMIISHIATLVFLSAVAYYGYEYIIFLQEFEEMSIDLGIEMWYVYLVIPIAFSFAAFRVGEKIYEIIITPAEDVIPKSEAEMIIQQMAEGENEKLLKEVEKKTGGLL